MKRLIATILLLLLPSLAAGAPRAAAWRELAEGIGYATVTIAMGEEEPSTILHAFRIDPKKFRIDVVRARNEKSGATADEMARQTKATLVINGGFFTPEHASIGLIVKDGRELSPIHNTSWWSVFAIANEKPMIVAPKDFAAAKDVRMALQVGPRLAIAGRIPKLKESVAARSAIGITPAGEVVIAITQGPGISMQELARRMSTKPSDGGLNCPDAMALDGGSSSQISAKVKKFELNLPNLARVTNGLAVFPK